MAEVLGLVSGGLSVLSLAIQLGECVFKLRSFSERVKYVGLRKGTSHLASLLRTVKGFLGAFAFGSKDLPVCTN